MAATGKRKYEREAFESYLKFVPAGLEMHPAEAGARAQDYQEATRTLRRPWNGPAAPLRDARRRGQVTLLGAHTECWRNWLVFERLHETLTR